ncbi:MAG: hypothetical protein ABI193_03420 [Minicystis sp.]
MTVFERDAIGASLRRWGPTRFFSPLAMNLPEGAAALLGDQAPPADALLTGPDFVDRILVPLASTPLLAGRVLTAHRVLSVGRAGMTRGEYAGHPLRGERPFRLLVETPRGEQLFEADAVLDASGTYGQPNALGVGGQPAPGERAASDVIVRDLGTLHARIGELEGRRVLLAGNGHSAANAMVVLEELARTHPETRVIWASRAANLRPCTEVASDPLPERQTIVARANQLAAKPPAWLHMERRASVESLTRDAEGALQVSLSGGRSAQCDVILSLTGYRPDHTFISELPLEIDPATQGAGRLSRALSSLTDCLAIPTVTPADLASGEPRFHLAGAKSYGRASTFLLRTGYAQLETILDALVSEART